MNEITDRDQAKTKSTRGLPLISDRKNSTKLYKTSPGFTQKDPNFSGKLLPIRKTIKEFIKKAKSFISNKTKLSELNGSFISKFRYVTQYFSLPKTSDAKKQQTLRHKASKLNAVDDKIIRKLQDYTSTSSSRKKIKNHNGDYLGTIQKLTFDDENNIRYVILYSTNLFGKKDRYFAIPLSPDLIELTEKGKLIMKLNKDQLRLAKGITAQKCPKPSLEFGQSIYELYSFNEAKQRK